MGGDEKNDDALDSDGEKKVLGFHTTRESSTHMLVFGFFFIYYYLNIFFPINL